MKPNDMHMYIEDSLVMVQWGEGPFKDIALLTTSTIDYENGRLRGGSVNLDADQRGKIIQALRGDAPPCTCRVCVQGGPRIGP